MSTKRLKKFIYNDSKTICDIRWKSSSNLDGINLFKVNFGNTRTMREIGSKVSLQTTERRHWPRSGVLIVNFEQISLTVLMFPLLPLKKQMLGENNAPHSH